MPSAFHAMIPVAHGGAPYQTARRDAPRRRAPKGPSDGAKEMARFLLERRHVRSTTHYPDVPLMTVATLWSSTFDRVRSWLRPAPAKTAPAEPKPLESVRDAKAQDAATSEGMAEAPKKSVVTGS